MNNQKKEHVSEEYGRESFKTILAIVGNTDKYVTKVEFNDFRKEVKEDFRDLNIKIDSDFKTHFRWMIGLFATLFVSIGGMFMGIMTMINNMQHH